MATIDKNQLKFTYTWTVVPPDDPKVTGRPDSTELNRHEGYEVLAFLNRHTENLADAQKAERMINHALPASVRSHANVFEWLKANWQRYL